MRSQIRLGLALALFCARNAAADDYWDKALFQDDNVATDNELVHGTVQQHDLEASAGPVADVDFYDVNTYGTSSYEALIDSMSGDLRLANDSTNFQRLDITGTTVLQSSEDASVGASFGPSRALRWLSTGPFAPLIQFLRVQSANCGALCGPEDQYRIRFYDTTIAVPRFNNSGGQVTVLVIQNPTGWTRDITGNIYFWGPTGLLLDISPFSLGAKAALVLNTATIGGAAGQAGTITIAHDGGYGNLAVKAVALELATGFSFDSPGLYKPH